MFKPLLNTVRKTIQEVYREPRCDDEGNICTTTSVAGLPTRKWLTASGDGLGTFNLNGDYSVTPLVAYYQTDTRYEIYTLVLSISDASKFNQIYYGGIAAGLTNGITFSFYWASIDTIFPMMINTPIKYNYEWFSLTAHANLTSFDGTAQTLVIEIPIKEHYGKPLVLNPGDKFMVNLNDDFTGLVSQTFYLMGIKF